MRTEEMEDPEEEWLMAEDDAVLLVAGITQFREAAKDISTDELVRWHRLICMLTGDDELIKSLEREDVQACLAIALMNADECVAHRTGARRFPAPSFVDDARLKLATAGEDAQTALNQGSHNPQNPKIP